MYLLYSFALVKTDTLKYIYPKIYPKYKIYIFSEYFISTVI